MEARPWSGTWTTTASERPSPSSARPARRDTVDIRNLIVFFWAETLAH